MDTEATDDGTARVLGHVTQDNGELTEDVVDAAVVDSTAVAEDGGVRSVDVDDRDRLVWVAPLPDEVGPVVVVTTRAEVGPSEAGPSEAVRSEGAAHGPDASGDAGAGSATGGTADRTDDGPPHDGPPDGGRRCGGRSADPAPGR